jgi:prepilin-type N-terminal cleavage/methylation domain-containing protein
MKTTKSKRGFTLIELLVVISIIAMLAAGAYTAYGAMMPKFKANSAAKKAGTIATWLNAYAIDNGGSFPEGDTANLALRELFKKDKYGADEMQFMIDGCVYHKSSANKKGPDGDKGSAPEFAQALEQGENAFAYVSGLSNEGGDTRIPLLANGFTETIGQWTKDRNKKGGVFSGKYAVVLRVGGGAKAEDIDEETNFEVREKKSGAMMNIFSADFGTPDTVRNPD